MQHGHQVGAWCCWQCRAAQGLLLCTSLSSRLPWMRSYCRSRYPTSPPVCFLPFSYQFSIHAHFHCEGVRIYHTMTKDPLSLFM